MESSGLPAIVVAVMAVLTILVVRDTPEDAGLEPFDPQDATSGDTEKITLGYVARKVFTNPIAITIAAAEFCTGFVRKGFEEWFPRYMQEAQHLALDHPVFQRGAMQVVIAGIAVVPERSPTAGTIRSRRCRSRTTRKASSMAR